ncbi:MAG: ATP phosphoribosyltransferase regulatory subunit [Caulobacteraceae bacterium]|nr:ATP phosphoribosyltransferase regulatory subunit [Caulobacter sp.]
MIAAREPAAPPATLAAIRAEFAGFGGEWTGAPVLQPLSVLLDLAGEAMRARLYVLSAEGGEEQALRPDFTIALARGHIASGVASARRLYEGDAFRLPPPGSGRAGEFAQLGVEVFGEAGDAATLDGEVAALAWRAACAGGRDDLELHFGDVSLFAAFTQALALPDGARTRLTAAFAAGRPMRAEVARLAEPVAAGSGGRLARLLGELPEAEAAAALEEVWRLAGVQPVGGREAGEIVHRLAERAEAARTPRLSAAEADLLMRFLQVNAPPIEALDRVQRLAHEAHGALDPVLDAWRRRLDALAQGGAPLDRATLACAFVRPFSYYDGALFEVRSPALPADAPVAAGGRSDGLLARLGGAAAPSVGCMVRPGRAWAGGGA